MKKGVAAVAALVVLAGGGAGLWFGFERPAPAAAAPRRVAGAGIPVTAGTVVAANVPVFARGIGSVQAFNTVTVRSRVDGQIVGVDFTEGQEVKSGDRLYQIDPRPYQAALEQARAAKAKDEAQLQGAQADLERYSRLVGSGFQTRQSYDQQKALVAQLHAAIAGDQAQIDTAQLNLGYAQIRAPISGRLGARLVDIGNLVRASDNTALVSITQLKPIFVSFTLPQQQLDEVRANQEKAPLVVEAMSGDDKTVLAHGKLTLIDNAIDQATGTIHLKATFANRDERLWPGQFVNVRVIVRTRRAVPTVPAQTVMQGPDGYFAYVIKPGDTVERRPVQVASIQNGIAVVAKGLALGERVVVDGQYRLVNGARVNPLPSRGSGSTS